MAQMDNRTLRRIARQVREAAQGIADLDSDLVMALMNNDVDVPMPQELENLAEAVEDLTNYDNAWAARGMAEHHNPGKAVWWNEWNMRSWVPGVPTI